MGRLLTLFGSGSQGAASPFLLQDTFTDTNGTSLASHTMDVGGGWTIHGGTWTVQSNKAQYGSSDAFHCVTADAGQADVVVRASVTLEGFAGLALRVTDDDNGWMLLLRPGDGTANLYEHVATGFTQRATAAVTLVIGNTYLVEATCSGASISWTVDGGNAGSYGSATFQQTATRHGLFGFTNTNKWDDFEVEAG